MDGLGRMTTNFIEGQAAAQAFVNATILIYIPIGIIFIILLTWKIMVVFYYPDIRKTALLHCFYILLGFAFTISVVGPFLIFLII